MTCYKKRRVFGMASGSSGPQKLEQLAPSIYFLDWGVKVFL